MLRTTHKVTILFLALSSLVLQSQAWAEQWSVPLAGNSFRTQPSPGGRGVDRSGSLKLLNPEEVYSVYFHVDRPAELRLKLVGRINASSKVLCSVDQAKDQADKFSSTVDAKNIDRGFAFSAAKAGYVRLDFQAQVAEGSKEAVELTEILIDSENKDLKLDFVKNNDGNMFYWGRRGPSVHLSYQVPKDVKLQFGYTELTVPEGEDPIGSYYMANGFGEGYFGMQVNSASERRILFSVWSPFNTDNPKDIPVDQQIELLAKGPNTRVGQFGNEGSGGQSFMIYPWKAGKTYRFLTEVKPIDDNNTHYTCWFSEKSEDWILVASFRRPKTSTHLRGFHSFLESFDPSHGYISRRCSYGNVWVADTNGKWHACDKAKFSVDPTGGSRHRLDFEGGVDGSQFFLHNCGFFSGAVKAGTMFQLPETKAGQASVPPAIELDSLPRE